jgi:hypothetical protein
MSGDGGEDGMPGSDILRKPSVESRRGGESMSRRGGDLEFMATSKTRMNG